MAITNYDRVTKAMDLLRQGLVRNHAAPARGYTAGELVVRGLRGVRGQGSGVRGQGSGVSRDVARNVSRRIGF